MATEVLVSVLTELTYKGAKADVTQVIVPVMRALKENTKSSSLEEAREGCSEQVTISDKDSRDLPPGAARG